MNLRKSMTLMLGLGLLAFIVACSSTPETVSTGPDKSSPAYDAYENATKLRTKVNKFGFAKYAETEYAAGESSYKAGMDTYKADPEGAKNSFTNAADNYKVVMRKGIAARSKELDDEVLVSIRKADELKAKIALKDDYAKAHAKYDRAVALAKEENWDEAEPLYNESRSDFEQVYVKTKELKDQAENDNAALKERINNLKDLEQEYKESAKTDSKPK